MFDRILTIINEDNFKKIQNILKIAEFALKLTRNQAESYDT